VFAYSGMLTCENSSHENSQFYIKRILLVVYMISLSITAPA
jgi:hypothetical protein